MLEISTLLTFIGTSFLLAISPGPDILFVITQGISNSKKTGVLTAIGLALGNLVHTLGAVLGASIIFKTSPLAFNIFKIIGVLYLFFLAYKAIKHRNEGLKIENKPQKVKSSIQTVAKGFIMNVFNPKVALFFLAFFPQFINPDLGQVHLQMILLGLIFVAIVIVTFGAFGYFSGYIADKFLRRSNYSKAMNVISAIVFIGIGIYLIFSKI
jgi:threonine/homoserine/homoserine lactone efflux protein